MGDCPPDISTLGCWLANYGSIIIVVLVAIAAAIAIFDGIRGLINNPANAKGAIIGIVVLIVIVGVAFALSSEEIPLKLTEFDVMKSLGYKPEKIAMFSDEEIKRIVARTCKAVGTGIFSFYQLISIAVLSILADTIKGFVK